WEFGAIPEDWLEPLRANVDELWVPSEYVRAMYVDAGIEPERVIAIPNGVDLDLFSPDGPRRELPPAATTFLFVGGVIGRKGADVLLEAWRDAFAGRDDVMLVVKDFGADGIYRTGDRGPLREHASTGALPRILLLDEKLTVRELAALYRAGDVLVHPYRGEGFAMPVLEAMACGLPVIVTAAGPTDEFVPDEAGWRIDSRRLEFAEDRIEQLATRGTPWVLEPEREHLVTLLREAAATPADERRARGAAARAAAARLSWDEIALRYQARIESLVARRPRSTLAAGPDPEPFPLTGAYDMRLLATPAWRAAPGIGDRLPELLAEWVAATEPGQSACLFLLADPEVDGDPEQLEARIVEAAAGADLDGAADIEVLMEPASPERDARLHAAMTSYVSLHPACAGHERMALEAGCASVELGRGALAIPLHVVVAQAG
ncbi:MAG: glycosyltransferase family 4 protein, partial [Solirubrobacteraceae bacterium]